jgi:hypothetical protein
MPRATRGHPAFRLTRQKQPGRSETDIRGNYWLRLPRIRSPRRSALPDRDGGGTRGDRASWASWESSMTSQPAGIPA